MRRLPTELGDGTLPVDWSDVDVAPEALSAWWTRMVGDLPVSPKEFLHAHDDGSGKHLRRSRGPAPVPGHPPRQREDIPTLQGRPTHGSALRSHDRG